MDKNAKLRREKVIIKTSIIGVLGNIMLSAFKAAVGILSNSIAVTLDAVNNLSDAASSIITIIAAKLAGREPDKTHPFGHGRIEYMSSMIVAALVLYAGITSLVESVKKIISPQEPSYTSVSVIILIAAIFVKLFLGLYVKSKGRQVNSGALIASGADALNDALISLSVLASAIIFLTTGLSLEAYVGVIIAGIIIKAGIEMISESVSDMLGARTDGAVTKHVKEVITSDEEVLGAYDLVIHNYGPNMLVGSVHVEIPGSMTADRIDSMTRRLQDSVYDKTGVILTAVGVYASNESDDEAAGLRSEITKKVMAYDGVLQLHGFYFDNEKKRVTFDVVLDFDSGDRRALYETISKDVRSSFPDYDFRITLDSDVSD